MSKHQWKRECHRFCSLTLAVVLVPLSLGLKPDKEDCEIKGHCCKKRGRIIVICPVLKRRNEELLALVSKLEKNSDQV